MGDSTAMTVEFLRARLLAERSVSRTARQRADELAQRVMELEEQLKIVSLQKMKAEKATEDVLAILEDNGISDVSEALDSNSDQEVVLGKSKVSDPSKKGEESSMNTEEKRNDVEEFSGSELDSSPSSCRSLSWRSSKDSQPSQGKKSTNSSRRRRSGIASTDSSSPKQWLGRSCRQTRHREMRSAVEEPKVKSVVSVPKDTDACNYSEDYRDCSSNNRHETLEEGSENQGKKVLLEGLVPGSCVEEREQFAADVNHNGNEGEKDMERALEHQAQLIGQFEAEEKAQREWEEKFRENNNGTPDSFEPGNYSDVTEERDECKVRSLSQKSKLKVESTTKLSKTDPNGFPLPSRVNDICLKDQECSSTLGYDSSASEFAFPMASTQNEERLRNRFPSPLNGTSSSPVDGSNKSSKADASVSQKELVLMSNQKSDGIGSVLEALQQARSSLKQKLNDLPLLEPSFPSRNAIEPSVPTMGAPEKAEIPVGCAQLFRVPNDFQFEATRSNTSGSTSQSGLTNYYPYMRNALTTGDRFTASPYMETRSSASTSQINGWSRLANQKPPFDPYSDRGGDRLVPAESKFGAAGSSQFLTSSYVRSMPRSGPYSDSGLPSSSRYTYPMYSELMPQLPFNDGYLRPISRATEEPPAERFSLYGDHIRPNMYR